MPSRSTKGCRPPPIRVIAWAFDRRYARDRAATDWPRGAPVSTLLRDFRALTKKTDEEIVAFAKRYGILGVCPHMHQPTVRQWHRRTFPDCLKPGREAGGLTVAIEPIATWRLLAQRADAALLVRAHLAAGSTPHTPGVGVLWRAFLDESDRPDLPGHPKYPERGGVESRHHRHPAVAAGGHARARSFGTIRRPPRMRAPSRPYWFRRDIRSVPPIAGSSLSWRSSLPARSCTLSAPTSASDAVGRSIPSFGRRSAANIAVCCALAAPPWQRRKSRWRRSRRSARIAALATLLATLNCPSLVRANP